MPIIDSVSESLDELADAEASFKKRRKKGDRRSSQILDRLPPHSTEAEMGVLGCVLIEPSILPEARAKIKSHIVFYDLRHQTIWETLCAMSDASTPIDLITVQQNLKDRQLLEQIGGIAYLSQLQDAVPSAANFSYYASITLEKHALRRTIATCSGVVGKVYDYEGEVEALITEVEREILSIRGTFNNDADLVDISSVQQKVIAQYEAAFNGNQHFGLQTGFDGLDNIIGGMLEQELIMVGGSPSAGKCLKWDSEILLADGSVKTIGDIYGARSASLLTLGDDLRFKIVSASDFVDDGIKPTFCVKTRLGKKISTTSTHPFLTISGWKKLSELKPGDKVAVPRRAGVFGNRAASDDAIKVLAYLIGDGCMVHGGTPLFTNKNPRLMNEFVESAGREFGSVCKIHGPASGRSPTAHVSHNKSKHNKDVVAFQKWIGAALDNSGISDRQIALRIGKSTSLPSMWRSGVCVPSFEDCAILGELLCVNVEEMASTPRVEAKNKLAAWLKEIGIFGKDSFSKFIPQFIFTCPKRQVALFLNRLFATDGFACVAKDGRSQIGYSSNSERLCRQVQHLLLRFGIVAMVRKKNMTVNELPYETWVIEITDAIAKRIFAGEIGIFGKEENILRVIKSMRGKKYQTNIDLIPREIWPFIKENAGMSMMKLALNVIKAPRSAGRLRPKTRDLSRDRMLKIARATGIKRLFDLAEGDVFWDEIISIESEGLNQVYDLTIPETHNFVANDICVHNTSLILNIIHRLALEKRIPIGMFSIDDPADTIIHRLACIDSRVNGAEIRRGRPTEEDMVKLSLSMAKISASKDCLMIDDSGGGSEHMMLAKARRMVQRGAKIIFIDYLQIIPTEGDGMYERTTNASHMVKRLAKESRVPVVCISAITKPTQAKADWHPTLQDFRGSGDIDYDVNQAWLLYRDPEDMEDEFAHIYRVVLDVGKNKQGPTGRTFLQFFKESTKFEQASNFQPPT